MPTKPEQGDLEHVLYTSQGDSNRVVFAPGTVAEAYDQTRQAFKLSYEYQIPSIVVYDQKLSGEYVNVPASHFDREPNGDPGSVVTEEELQDLPHDPSGTFNRFQHDPGNDRGVSPRSLPGQKDGRFLVTGNEHSEAGHIEEDPRNRVVQMDRRMKKLTSIREEMDAGVDEAGSANAAYGPDDAEYGILTWGSNQGTVFEAVDRLNDAGHSVKALGVSELAPYPEAQVSEFLASVDDCLVVEMNATAQFRGLTQKELGRYGEKLSSLLKYNGNPFEPREVVEGFEASIDEGSLPGSSTKYVPAAGD
jgi:pyruvate ferredoxin oxidoreductase alpha subunit